MHTDSEMPWPVLFMDEIHKNGDSVWLVTRNDNTSIEMKLKNPKGKIHHLKSAYFPEMRDI